MQVLARIDRPFRSRPILTNRRRPYSDAPGLSNAARDTVQFLSRIKRDYYAGALMVLIGAIAINEARGYQLGTLQKMGPGYFPIALGALLILLGILIAGTASTGGYEEQEAMPHAEWRGWFCIIAGPVLFVVFGRYLGLGPATFACVFVSAL